MNPEPSTFSAIILEMSERVVAYDSVLPTLLEERVQPWILSVPESRPVQTRSGPK